MNQRAALSLFAALAGCASWTVVRETDPCPYRDVRSFDVVDLRFVNDPSDLPPESGFLSRRESIDRWRVLEDRRVIREGYFEELIDRASDAGLSLRLVPTATLADTPYVLRPRVTRLLPGGPTVADPAASELEITLSVVGPRGVVVDEVALITNTDPTGEYFDRDRRLRRGGQLLGQRTVAYLESRMGL